MGKITDALKKAAEDRMSRLEKMDSRDEVRYQFIAQKTVESSIDPRIVAFYEKHSPVAEQYRSLRTNILALKPDKQLRSVTVTSSINSEGKTVTAINLAISMAQDLNKKKIVLIDGDMRRGRVSRYLGVVDCQAGLSDLLHEDNVNPGAFINIGIDNLTIVPSGKYPANPAELLGSMRFRNLLSLLKEKYDFIIIDAPPIIPVTDAGIIGSQTDGVLMVVQAGRTQRGVVKHSESLLKQAQAKILGFILSNVQYHVPAYIYRYL